MNKILTIVLSCVCLALVNCSSEEDDLCPGGKWVYNEITKGKVCYQEAKSAYPELDKLESKLSDVGCAFNNYDDKYVCDKSDLSKMEPQINALYAYIIIAKMRISKFRKELLKQKNKSEFEEVELNSWQKKVEKAKITVGELEKELAELNAEKIMLMERVYKVDALISKTLEDLKSDGCLLNQSAMNCTLNIDKTWTEDQISAHLESVRQKLKTFIEHIEKKKTLYNSNKNIKFEDESQLDNIVSSAIKARSIAIDGYIEDRLNEKKLQINNLVLQLQNLLNNAEVEVNTHFNSGTLTNRSQKANQIIESLNNILSNVDYLRSKLLNYISINDSPSKVYNFDYWSYSDEYIQQNHIYFFMNVELAATKNKIKLLSDQLIDLSDKNKIVQRDNQIKLITEKIQKAYQLPFQVTFLYVTNYYNPNQNPFLINDITKYLKLRESDEFLDQLLKTANLIDLNKKDYDLNRNLIIYLINDIKDYAMILPRNNCTLKYNPIFEDLSLNIQACLKK